MLVGDQHLFEAAYFNNTGLRESARFEWSSSDLDVTQINENGTAFALGAGETTISYTANGITDSFLLTVLDPTLVNEDSIRMMQEESQEGDRVAELVTVSSYALTGTVILRNDGGLKLIFSEDFETTDALPGLYVYLTNNTATINNALEVGEVEDASGFQEYELPRGVQLFDYSHVLLYCKPFRVAVGEGKFEP